MKLAKKVLSVVLALVLALSAFAVVGSANGNPDADYQVKIWLTGTVGEVNWTTSSRVSMSETGSESDPGATIEVQPGDEVFVRFYLTNNYYVHTFQTNVFYSSGLLDAGEIYVDQTGKACTSARITKMLLWNDDKSAGHYWTATQGTGVATANVFSMMTETFQNNTKQNWPTDDEGNVLLDMEDWEFAIFNNLTQEKSGETCIWEDDVWVFSMPVSIPADAKPGDTFYVTIPEGLEQRDAKPNGALRLSEIGIAEGEEEPCDIVDAQALLTPNMSWGNENQYYDLSEATLTLVVPGASEPELDFSALNAKLAEAAEALKGNITDDSKAALNDAIANGTAALSATSQDDIDAAVTELVAAIDGAEDLADFAELNAAIERYDALDPAAWSNFDSATAVYNAAKAISQTNTGVSAQATVDDAADALNAAIDALAPALDYSALNAKIAEVKDTDTSIYTDATAGAFNAALAAAQSLVATSQAEIDKALADLDAAYKALEEKAANYAALDAAIEAFEDIDAKAWTVDSYEAAKAKYDAAKAVARDLKITAQATIDAAAADLNEAITALVPATGANYNELNAAKAEFEALVADYYTTDSYAAAKTAYDAACEVPAGLTANDQDQIDAAAAALNEALGKLVEADADYSAVTAAITAAKAKIAENDQGILRYTDESIANVNEAIDAVVEGLKKKDQPVVNGYADAINAAVAALEYRPYDYTAINNHIAAIEANDADYYDAASYAEYLAKKEALVLNYTHEQFAKAKLQEITFLKVNPVAAAAADYSAVEDAIAAFEAKKAAADYTEDSIAAVDAEIAKVVYGLNANHQAEVDAFAAAINAAIDAMEEVVVLPADYTAVNDAIAAFRAKIAAADYEQDGIDEVEAIIADIDWNLDETAQDTVDAYAADIIAATEALVEIIPVVPADYTALDAAILRAGTYDQNVWTAETWAVVEEKLAAAKAVPSDLTADDQAIIDAAAKALNDALDALEAKEVVSKISTINYVRAEDGRYDITVAVTDRVAMVQFMEENGGTRTYDRYHKNVTVKSYNAAGEEVNALSRDVAYEVWSIHSNLTGPSLNARTKFLEGSKYVWETEKYAFELAFDVTIHSIEPAATSGKKGAVVTTVVTGADVQAVQFLMADGSTTSYSADKAEVLDDGTLKFTGKAWANDEGLNTITVRIKYNNGKWTAVDTFDYTVE